MESFQKRGAQVNQVFETPIADTGFKDIEDDEENDNIKIGMTVNSEDEAYELYCRYAASKGFDVRRGNTRKIDGVIRKRDFLCSCSGVYKDGDPSEQTKINRPIRRTDCRTFVRFTITDGVWEITHLNKEHNHEFVEPKYRHFLKINRKIDTASASILSSMVDAGIGATKAYSYVSKEVGGSDLVGFTKRDCQNFANERKMNLIEKGDAQAVMTRFRQSQVNDPMFFHLEDFDNDNWLSKVFWRDGRSKSDYDCFGDVMIFDTTYRTNKYNMIFAPFVGINHHRKSIFFECAFLPDEKTETFVWLFQTFLVAMGHRAPRTIFTDQAQAISNAIKVVFPNTCHRLCSWHISKNATQRIGSLYANSKFKRLFSKCLYDRMPESDFEATWSEMITK